jgi:MoxR-like ATPase
MKIFKLSQGIDFINSSEFDALRNRHAVCVAPDTRAKGRSTVSQGELFINAQAGDVFYVCKSNQSIELIGMFSDARPYWSDMNNKTGWVEKTYILLFDSKHPNGYNRNDDKWWMPKNNSTFTEVPNHELSLFEAKVLGPVFDLSLAELENMRQEKLKETNPESLDFYKDLQRKFNRLANDQSYLFEQINSLDETELKKLKYDYDARGGIEHQPVVTLRYRLIEKLLNGEALSKEVIEEEKKKIDSSFSKNVFRAWSDPFRILYALIYAKYKQGLIDFFEGLINKLRSDLGIVEDTKFKLVHFDGAQNQGQTTIWMAIYNKIHKSQKYAQQLFFEVVNGYRVGYIDHVDRPNDDVEKFDDITYDQIINILRKHKNKVVEDDSEGDARLAELAELLDQKHQIVLQGPPGTGKTYTAEQLAEFVIKSKGKDLDHTKLTKLAQFHPSYSYEDFVRGIVAETGAENNVAFITKNRLLADFAQQAIEAGPEVPHVLIIDEINRANLPAVLGELIYALEYRGREVQSLYAVKGKREIILPENLYIIGTMNTADRSVGHIDYAIRRRFAFVEMLPEALNMGDEFQLAAFEEVSRLFVVDKDKTKPSDFISDEFKERPQDVWIGHSYFIADKDTFPMRLKYEIIPILEEYLKDGILNSEAKEEIRAIEAKFSNDA